jgi:glycerophosphoryl diester phosphodiesterase
LRASVPGLKAMSRASLKGCLLRYIAYGWTGAMPKTCHATLVFVPINAAPWLWGWPNRFLARMAAVDSAVFVIGPYHGGGFSTGIDGHAELSRLPENYGGGVLTNEIETAAAWFRSRK